MLGFLSRTSLITQDLDPSEHSFLGDSVRGTNDGASAMRSVAMAVPSTTLVTVACSVSCGVEGRNCPSREIVVRMSDSSVQDVDMDPLPTARQFYVLGIQWQSVLVDAI